MAPVYSKSFFYDTVSPGTPVSFMTGASTETWIVRNILCVVGSGATGWNVEITDDAGNVIWSTDTFVANPTVQQPIRLVLMPMTSYTVSAGTYPVFVAIDGYVLSA